MTVSVVVENPHSFWYTTYKGDGALDADAKSTKIAAVAVGDPDITAGSDTFRIRQDLSQDQHVEGLPLGTIGGTAVRYTFPLSGDYVFQAKLYRTNLNILRGLEYPHEVEVAIDGRRVYVTTIGGPEDLASLFDKPTDTSDAVDARLRVRVPVTGPSKRKSWPGRPTLPTLAR